MGVQQGKGAQGQITVDRKKKLGKATARLTMGTATRGKPVGEAGTGHRGVKGKAGT